MLKQTCIYPRSACCDMTESDIASSTQLSLEASTAQADRPTRFEVHFWGVRGGIPTPRANTVRYGGNTTCVEVLAGKHRLIFDGGTGLHALGQHLLRKQNPVEARIFFTHAHWDRIQGFPYFVPAFQPHNRFHIYGAPAPNGASIKQCLTDQMLRPNFFVPLQKMRADMDFHNISAGSVIAIDDVLVETISLNRHTSSLGYRVTYNGQALVYATDTDHTQEQLDPNLLYLASQADVLIFDGTYADMGYPDLQKPEHEPWRLGVQLAQCAQVRKLVLFHHAPCHNDDDLDRLEKEIQGQFAEACLAHEGLVIQLA